MAGVGPVIIVVAAHMRLDISSTWSVWVSSGLNMQSRWFQAANRRGHPLYNTVSSRSSDVNWSPEFPKVRRISA